jgi:ATP-binding cassette subfamily C protein LapB
MNEQQVPVALTAKEIGRMLGRLKVAFDAPALAAAVGQLATAYAPAKLAEWLRAVLARAGVRGVAPVVMAWRRFDTQRLPAWVWHEGRWREALRSTPAGVDLAQGEGVEVVALEALHATLVLWLRVQVAQDDFSATRSPSARMVMRELLRDPGWLWKVALATVSVNVLAVASSLFSMQVYDRVVPTLAYSTLATLAVGMGLVMGMEALLKTSRARILDSLACAVDERLSQQVFSHLMQVQLDAQPRSVGTLAAQVGGLDSVRQFFSSTVIFGLVDVPFALMFLAVIALVGGQVAWVYALALPLSLLAGWISHRRLKALVQRQMSRSNERQGVLVDAIRGAESIRAANAGWRFEQEWQDITRTIDAYAIQQKATHSGLSVGLGLLSSLAYVAAIVVGVWEVEAGRLSSGGIVACSMLGSRVITPAIQAVQYLAQWEQVQQALRMVDRVLTLPAQRRHGQTLLSPSFVHGPLILQLEQVRYAYPGSPLVQVQMAEPLTLRGGERVLLLGPVGCGKSTLLKLLGGLYRPGEGRIRLAGADLWEIDPQVLASHVGYLPQEASLFKGSLRSNLALSGVSSDAQVDEVSLLLGVDRIAAASPQGMDLMISEGGSGLSGGQRQLVALSRVVLAQPRVWLLDEPTASLDGESEARVWRTLSERVGPQDILVVATHKPQLALKFATRVIVLREGKVVRDGSPREVFSHAFDSGPAAEPVQRMET